MGKKNTNKPYIYNFLLQKIYIYVTYITLEVLQKKYIYNTWGVNLAVKV
jgi:hypothetical protein